MRYIIEDKKKISFIVNFLKSSYSNKPSVTMLWSQQNGWLIMQNQENLKSLDSSNLSFLAHFKPSYFSSTQYDLYDSFTFDWEITNALRLLKSLNKSIKRLTFQVLNPQHHANQQTKFQIIINSEEGQCMIEKEVYLNLDLNQNIYFREMKEFTQEKNKCIEIKQEYLKSLKEIKNDIVELCFHEDHINIKSASNLHDIETNISTTVLGRYEFGVLDQSYDNRNKLIIPPNFLLPQTNLASKLGKEIEISFGDIVQDKVEVFCRTITDQCEIVSCFSSILEIGNQINGPSYPFEQNRQNIASENNQNQDDQANDDNNQQQFLQKQIITQQQQQQQQLEIENQQKNQLQLRQQQQQQFQPQQQTNLQQQFVQKNNNINNQIQKIQELSDFKNTNIKNNYGGGNSVFKGSTNKIINIQNSPDVNLYSKQGDQDFNITFSNKIFSAHSSQQSQQQQQGNQFYQQSFLQRPQQQIHQQEQFQVPRPQQQNLKRNTLVSDQPSESYNKKMFIDNDHNRVHTNQNMNNNSNILNNNLSNLNRNKYLPQIEQFKHQSYSNQPNESPEQNNFKTFINQNKELDQNLQRVQIENESYQRYEQGNNFDGNRLSDNSRLQKSYNYQQNSIQQVNQTNTNNTNNIQNFDYQQHLQMKQEKLRQKINKIK